MSLNHRRIPQRHWQWLRRETLRAGGYKCNTCGGRGRRLEVDHVVPLHDGGESVLENLQVLCRDCHIAKTRREYGRGGPPDGGEWERFAAASRFHKARGLFDAG